MKFIKSFGLGDFKECKNDNDKINGCFVYGVAIGNAGAAAVIEFYKNNAVIKIIERTGKYDWTSCNILVNTAERLVLGCQTSQGKAFNREINKITGQRIDSWAVR